MKTKNETRGKFGEYISGSHWIEWCFNSRRSTYRKIFCNWRELHSGQGRNFGNTCHDYVGNEEDQNGCSLPSVWLNDWEALSNNYFRPFIFETQRNWYKLPINMMFDIRPITDWFLDFKQPVVELSLGWKRAMPCGSSNVIVKIRLPNMYRLLVIKHQKIRILGVIRILPNKKFMGMISRIDHLLLLDHILLMEYW